MSQAHRWTRGIAQRGADVSEFVDSNFAEPCRSTILIAGAGFDPRSTIVANCLAASKAERLQGVFIRENRPNPNADLCKRADEHTQRLMELLPNSQTTNIDIFAPDNAVVGGRNATRAVHDLTLTGISDVVVDTSALSMGISFPIIRYFYEREQRADEAFNLHVMVADKPFTDDAIAPTASDAAELVYGFRGSSGISAHAEAAKLWLPCLFRRQRPVLERLHSYLRPDDTCPIFPLSHSNPRRADELIEHYREQLESVWEVDVRNVIYADETSPLDLYRTILKIDDARRRVFANVGGAMTILSPIGSKVLAIGALMAAIERNLPVVYVEAVGYSFDTSRRERDADMMDDMVHVWLSGEPYCRCANNEDAIQ